MQAIRTKYFGPSNVRGSRIQASCEAQTIYVNYNHALDSNENHRVACEHLMRAMGWSGDMIGGWHGLAAAMYWVPVSGDRAHINGTGE